MAYNTFEFVGNIYPCKQTDKFTPYEEKTYSSGWVNRSLRFNVICDTNRHTLEVRGGCWKDGHGNVVTSERIQENGQIKYEKLEVKWSDRMKPEIISRVADFRKFVVDLEAPGKRKMLSDLIKAFDDGSVTDEMLTAAGVETENEAKEALAYSETKRHTFITEYDFASYLNTLVNSNNIKNKKFLIRGNINITEYEGKFYTHYQPQKIYLAADDTECKSEGTYTVCFDENCIDDGSLEDKGVHILNTYTFNYDSQRKTNIPCPVTLSLPVGADDKAKKLSALLLRNFVVDGSDNVPVKELGVRVNIIDGAEKLELTEDMLTENERDLLLLGEITMEELIRERGGNVYGDRKRDWVVVGFARGWAKGAQPTAYTSESFIVPPIVSAADNMDMGEEETVDEDEI